MNCINENRLQAYIDLELSVEEGIEIESHLDECEQCRNQYNQMLQVNAFCLEKLGTYQVTIEVQVNRSLEENGARKGLVDEPSQLTLKTHSKGANRPMKPYKKYLMTACALGILIVGATLEPVRATVGDAVSIFRANDIKTVSISLDDLKKIEDGLKSREGSIQIENLADISQSGGDYKEISAKDAQNLVNFPLSEVSGLKNQEPTRVDLLTQQTMDFVLNVSNMNGLMTSLGAEKLFPESIDGKKFSIYVPAAVSKSYLLGDEKAMVTYVQTKLPTINAPEGTDMKELIGVVASLKILPTNVQDVLNSMTNLDETLYIPNVDNKLEKMTIGSKTVYGSFGTNEDGQSYGGVFWLEDGVLKSLSGDLDKAVAEQLIKGE